MAKIASASAAVQRLRIDLAAEQIVVQEKQAATQALIESIGREKAAADVAVESSRGDEAAAAALAAQVGCHTKHNILIQVPFSNSSSFTLNLPSPASALKFRAMFHQKYPKPHKKLNKSPHLPHRCRWLLPRRSALPTWPPPSR